jgi:NarL family two-component system response regulator LiaR
MRVVIADDHRLMLNAVRGALETDGGFDVVGVTSSGAEVLDLVRDTKPDLVLLDVRMPEKDGLTCLAEIRQRYPEIKVVMLSASRNQELIDSALRGGASAYVLKNVDPSDLPSTIRQAVSGTVFGSSSVETQPSGKSPAGILTEREAAILRALARGLSNDEIAKELWVTQQTVKFHLTNIYRKTGTKNRTDAARYAFEHGLAESRHLDED